MFNGLKGFIGFSIGWIIAVIAFNAALVAGGIWLVVKVLRALNVIPQG